MEKIIAKISVQAIKCTQNIYCFYVITLNSSVLKGMCFVSRKKEDPIKGFQRLLSSKRAKDIANYLDIENGVIPSALVLSAQTNADISFVNTYPSKLRNRVNYQPIYGLQYIDRKLYPINENISWINQLLHYSKTDDDNQIACYMYAYTKYIEQFANNLVS